MQKNYYRQSGFWAVIGALGVAALGAEGCSNRSPNEPEKTVQASGIVTYQGKPLEMYQVTVHPEGRRPAAGLTDASGRFVLGTNREGDGAAPGTHPVTVFYAPPSIETQPGTGIYADPPPPSVKIPSKYADVAQSGLTITIPESGSNELKIEIQ